MILRFVYIFNLRFGKGYNGGLHRVQGWENRAVPEAIEMEVKVI